MNSNKQLTVDEIMALKDRLAAVGVEVDLIISSPFAEIVDALLEKLGV